MDPKGELFNFWPTNAMLTCCICKSPKQDEDFSPSERTRRGPRCRSCAKIKSAQYVAANKEEVYRKNREYYTKNSATMKAQASLRYIANREDILQYHREYYTANKDTINRKRSEDKQKWTFVSWCWRLKQFGLTVEQYADILKKQNGSCAICHTRTSGGRNGQFVVDHCHTTGLVRGLLCQHCNIGLGQFRDNPETLKAAIKYLTKGHTISDDTDQRIQSSGSPTHRTRTVA